ncbi:hypothetical protein WP9W18E04_08180 [Aeromonas veronii]|nr:hypothetical protein WP9W18E04_08180 [Aeromonas veronii]
MAASQSCHPPPNQTAILHLPLKSVSNNHQ